MTVHPAGSGQDATELVPVHPAGSGQDATDYERERLTRRGLWAHAGVGSTFSRSAVLDAYRAGFDDGWTTEREGEEPTS